ncbi:FixH family protein [Aestuariibacter sp. A3R04]|uniref:FixH family protein n=1 Tax=Aestuariibacter sp. A3R04 TaxID=2841571 RepID=UPI001C0A2C79|nr:FixH family protein [Aestuariibacter sp. A3R04]MBU3022848.1 FixH family protein [Aestuariibacter sp. A3R04]
MTHTPWYKQFWPWFLITVPIVTVIMSVFLVYLASSTQDSLVIDDYYKEGKAINAALYREERARKQNISTELLISGNRVALKFHSGIPEDGTALTLRFFHVTLSDRDTEILLTRDAGGVYRGLTTQPLEGKWRVSLSPLDEKWKIQNTLLLPQSSPIVFNP